MSELAVELVLTVVGQFDHLVGATVASIGRLVALADIWSLHKKRPAPGSRPSDCRK